MSTLEPASVSPLPEGITDPNYKPLPGRLGNLTPAQQHALDTLKRQLVDEGHFVPERMDDATLLRFVRGPCTRIDLHTPINVDVGAHADRPPQIPARSQIRRRQDESHVVVRRAMAKRLGRRGHCPVRLPP